MDKNEVKRIISNCSLDSALCAEAQEGAAIAKGIIWGAWIFGEALKESVGILADKNNR